ncbi:MAG TPA: mechanosensitive ion channel family protein [Longimicrobium sp.]|nr:mechanosensitive ion channel family protein [Longimicrobium sp.]
MRFLEWTFYGNSAGAWVAALFALAGAVAVLLASRLVLLRGLRRIATRTHNTWDDAFVATAHATRWWFSLLISLWIASRLLVLPPRVRETIDLIAILALLLQIAVWGRAAILTYVEAYTGRTVVEEDAPSVTTVRALGFLATLGLWSVLILMALDNLGIDITALVAGLGIGGIAVALAVQNILGDLFASLSIVLDKPFVYGDFIVVDDLMGTVERVGVKTTRVRSLSGEQLVFSNSDLLGSRIRNYKRMRERRVVFSVGVVYQTPHAQLAAIPQLLRGIVEAQPDVRFDRAHLKELAAASLDFEVVYYVLSPDFNVYMDRQQAINLEIFGRFEAEGIEFAYPTQTLHLAGPQGAPAVEESVAPSPAERGA